MPGRRGSWRLGLGFAALAVGSVVFRAGDAAGRRASEHWQAQRLPLSRGENWVGSDACRSCHPSEHASWYGSWHRTMTQEVRPETVIAAFDGRRLNDGISEFGVERRGDEFWVESVEPDWLLRRAVEGAEAVEGPPPMQWQRVVMSTGAHNMQMYWVPAGDGRRLIAFPFSWMVEAGRWVPNESTLLRPYEPHVVYVWNEVCIKCHAVAGAPEVDLEGVQSEVAELGIACESCHGPGAEHVASQSNPVRRYTARLGGESELHIVDPSSMSAKASSEICGQCHSASLAADEDEWLRRGSGYRAGAALAEHVRVVRHPVRADQPWIEDTLDADPDYLSGRFWPDGMIRISGRDYNGTLESPCAVDENFGCVSCHVMHGDEPDDQLKPEARGDAACLACHGELEGELEAHTRHASESVGSRCVNCHMPHTTYGLLKGIRSHQISIPNLEESVQYGRPNACNACHLDRSWAWTARELARGWGIEVDPELPLGSDETTGAAVRALVAGDAGQRALAAWAMGWPEATVAGAGEGGPDRRATLEPLLARALDDDYAAVRWIAARSLRALRRTRTAELPDWSVATPTRDPAAAREAAAAWTERGESELVELNLPATPATLWTGTGVDEVRYRELRAGRDERLVDLRE